MWGQDQIVDILLRAGANTQWTNKNGSTAATTACAKGHFAVVELLINHDSDLLDKPDGDGCVVTFASGKHVWAPTAICRFLLNRGCNVHATKDGSTALMMACLYGHLQALPLLFCLPVPTWTLATTVSKNSTLTLSCLAGWISCAN